jgi:hypothetical protein
MPEIRLIDMRGGNPHTVQKVTPLPTDPFARQALTNHPDTTLAQWRALSHDPVFAVRYAAATSHYVPSEMLALMVVDTHPFVRAGVANNPRTPDSALKALAKDSDENVAAAAQQNRATHQAEADELSL